jgi:hypothetical protein
MALAGPPCSHFASQSLRPNDGIVYPSDGAVGQRLVSEQAPDERQQLRARFFALCFC